MIFKATRTRSRLVTLKAKATEYGNFIWHTKSQFNLIHTLSCTRLFDHVVGKESAISQPTRPTQPAIHPGSVE